MDTPPRPDATVGAAARYRTLLEINNAVISNLTQDALFHAIAQALRGVVAFDRTAVFLHDPERDVLRLFVLESSLSTSYRSEEHTSELQSHSDLVCRLLLEKKKKIHIIIKQPINDIITRE